MKTELRLPNVQSSLFSPHFSHQKFSLTRMMTECINISFMVEVIKEEKRNIPACS